MKVYVLVGRFDYDQSDVLGVFSSYEKALEAKEDVSKFEVVYDNVEVESMCIDEINKNIELI